MAGIVQVIPNPTGGFTSSGGLMTLLVSLATVSEQLTNSNKVIDFNADGATGFGYMKRTGNSFSSVVGGSFIFTLGMQVRQDKNNNKTYFWPTVNGVAIPDSAVVFEAEAINDTNVISLAFAGVLAANDVVQFIGRSSLADGSTLLYTPSAPPIPGITAAKVVITGYRTGTTPTT